MNSEEDTFKKLCIATPEEIIEIYETWSVISGRPTDELRREVLSRGWVWIDAINLLDKHIQEKYSPDHGK
jgi:hypothetical protein